MPWARLVTYPGGTEEQYQAIQDALGDAHRNAVGRLFLTAGPSKRGWQIFMVWESREAFFSWAQRYVGPAHERAGERGWRTDPETLDFETFHVLPDTQHNSPQEPTRASPRAAEGPIRYPVDDRLNSPGGE